MKNRIYIYLAQRNKKGIRPIANLPFEKSCFPTKVEIYDLEKLNIPPEIKNEIYSEFQKNKLIYEIYLESASSFANLKESLKKRGFSNLPIQHINMNLNSTELNINESMLVTKKSTMLRKGDK